AVPKRYDLFGTEEEPLEPLVCAGLGKQKAHGRQASCPVIPTVHHGGMGLADLPEQRGERLRRYLAKRHGDADLDAIVVAARAQPCRLDWAPGDLDPDAIAILGSDGRYHLAVDGRPICSEHPEDVDLTPEAVATSTFDTSHTGQPTAGPSAADAPVRWRHQDGCWWWTDGEQYRMQAPSTIHGGEAGQVGESFRLDVSWLFTLTAVTADPVDIPARQRCPHHAARRVWPGFCGPGRPESGIRAELV